MKALTLWQPMAWAIARADKRIENRPRRPPQKLIGKRIAVHAGKRIHKPWISAMLSGYFGVLAQDVPDEASLITGAVVAVATIAGVVESQAEAHRMGSDTKWWAGPVGILLRDVEPLPVSVPCRGMQGYWNLDEDDENAVLAQLTVAR